MTWRYPPTDEETRALSNEKLLAYLCLAYFDGQYDDREADRAEIAYKRECLRRMASYQANNPKEGS